MVRQTRGLTVLDAVEITSGFLFQQKHSILKNWKEKKYSVIVKTLMGTTLGQSAKQGLIFHTSYFFFIPITSSVFL